MSEPVKFQHFEVLRRDDGSLFELGRGAMGITYKAFDTSLRCHVALKVIANGFLDSDEAKQRFLREARAAAALRHPNVATVFHLGNEEGTYFYVMEFVDGETVEAFIRREGAVPPILALQITSQVCRALAAAEKSGLVHRDLKPSNLMLVRQPDGDLVAKVIDFGLAKNTKHAAGEDVATLTMGGFMGTPHFASPEQLEEKDVDGRSDIYSLGATLWYMLAGKTPFTGSLVQIMSQHLHRDPPFEVLSALPPELSELLRRMMAKDPADRPQNAVDLRRDIDAVVDVLEARGYKEASPLVDDEGMATIALPTPTVPPPLPPTRITPQQATPAAPLPTATIPPPIPPTLKIPAKKPFPVLIVAAAAVVALIVLGVVGFFVSRPSEKFVGVDNMEPEPTPVATPSATPTPEPTPVPAPDGKDVSMVVAKDLENNGNLAGALSAYAKIVESAPDNHAARSAMERISDTIRQDLGSMTPQQLAQLRAPLEQAAELKVVPAQLALGHSLRTIDPSDALKWFKAAADAGDSEAMAQAGQMYASGKGGPINNSEAARLWEESAKQHDPAGCYFLGESLLLGKVGLPKNEKRAVDLLAESASVENVYAMTMLADLNLKGVGPGGSVLPPNPAEGVRLYQKAAERGSLDAKANLAVLYFRGVKGLKDGVEVEILPKDDAKMAELFKEGALKNHPFSMLSYAKCLLAGIGGPENSKEAEVWFIKAAQAGNREAKQWCADNSVVVPPAP